MGHANRVRQERQTRGLSVTALARAADVSRQTIYSIEGDPSYNVGLDTMRRIAAALGVSVGDLYQTTEAVAS